MTPEALIRYRLGRSVRSYRDLLNYLTREAVKGKITWDQVSKASAAVKVAVELLLSEKTLAPYGGDQEVPSTDEGYAALVSELGPLIPHRKTVITARTGVDKHGNTVDDKTVKIETGPGDTSADTDAQVLANV